MSLFPFVSFDAIALDRANELLLRWNHSMGACRRGCNDTRAHALYHEGRPVGIAVTASLIREVAGGGWNPPIRRAEAVELARLCAERRDVCRVVLRLWRLYAFPATGVTWAVSYQDAAVHSGDLYRFDGWERSPAKSRSGTDSRSGRIGRSKWVWRWPRGDHR